MSDSKYRANFKLLVHVLFRFHRAWKYQADGEIRGFGCKDCMNTYWGTLAPETQKKLDTLRSQQDEKV